MPNELWSIWTYFSWVEFSLLMDLRLYTRVLVLVTVFWLQYQNFAMEISDVSLEIDDDNDLSLL